MDINANNFLTNIGERAVGRGQGDSRNFLVQVQHAEPSETQLGVHRLTGYTIDERGNPTGSNVVVMIKAISGQRIPEAGDLIEAQKTTFLKMGASVYNRGATYEIFKAEYYSAFSSKRNDFAMHCEVLPCKPFMQKRINKTTNVEENVGWRSNLFGVDTSSAASVSCDSFLTDRIDKQIAIMLQPWLWKKESRTSVTHDISGKPLYGDFPRFGMTPAVLMRGGDVDIQIYGKPAVIDKSTGEIRRPTHEEVLEHLGRSKALVRFKDGIRDSGFAPEQLAQMRVCLVPALSAQIALNGAPDNKYLKFHNRYHLSGNSDAGAQGYGFNMTLFRCITTGISQNLNVDLAMPMPLHGERMGLPTGQASLTPYQMNMSQELHTHSQAPAPAPAPQQQAPAPRQVEHQQAPAQQAVQQQHQTQAQPAPAAMQSNAMPAHMQEEVPMWDGNDIPLPGDDDLAMLDDLNFDDYVEPQAVQPVEQPSSEQAIHAARAAAARRSSSPRM